MVKDCFNYSYNSQLFNRLMKQLFDGAPENIKNVTFDDIMRNNTTRLSFLIDLFSSKELDNAEAELLNDVKSYIVKFALGNNHKGFNIPDKFVSDKDDNCLILSKTEFHNILNLLNSSKELYENDFSKELSFLDSEGNVLCSAKINRNNVTNLMGISDFNIIDNKNIINSWKKFSLSGKVIDYIKYINNKFGKKPNLLFKHFRDKNYSNSFTVFLNYITSEEGKEDLLFLYNEQLLFIKEDRKNNPERYVNDKINPKRKIDFQNDYYDYIKDKYYNDFEKSDLLKEFMKREFPLLKTSKYITYLYYFINFLNMNDVYTFATKKTNDNDENLYVKFDELKKKIRIFFESDDIYYKLDNAFLKFTGAKDYEQQIFNKNNLVDIINDTVVFIEDDETKKMAKSFILLLDDKLINKKDNKTFIVNSNVSNYVNIMNIQDGNIISLIDVSAEDYNENDYQEVFIDKVLSEDKIVRVSSVKEEINFYNKHLEDKAKVSVLEDLSNKLVDSYKNFNVKDSNISLKNKYLKIVNIIDNAIIENHIVYEDGYFIIYKDDKKELTRIDFESMNLLGIFENQYMQRDNINSYLNLFKVKI